MITMFSLCFLVFLQLLPAVSSYGGYRENIPNGNNVPHPCKPGEKWPGVGHQLSEGRGSRNPFGVDFKAAGSTWTRELCEKDSDGDGLSNGVELGDPDCKWILGSPLSTTANLSHPGVCEPWTEPKCQQQISWLKPACSSTEFDCPAIEQSHVKQRTLKFPRTKVPAEDTTYICQEFELDDSDDFHLIATKAVIDNVNVMHHMILYACSDDSYPVKSTPFMCGMSAGLNCRTILGLWGFGVVGECFHENVGFRIGSKGYKRVALQMHWNNPTLKTDYFDESGMTIYYTNQKRQSNAGVLMVGPTYLEIPPKTVETIQEGVCPSSCTSRFIKEKIYIVSASNHMHYLGRFEKIEVFRNGSKLRDITNEVYEYDNPKVQEFKQPVELLPGDSLKTTCHFNSMSRDAVTYYGEATNAEMCFGFITYYPKENVDRETCTSENKFAHCEVVQENAIDNCPLYNYTRLTERKAFDFITLCYLHCTPDCLDLINSDPCSRVADTKRYLFAFWNFYPILKSMVNILRNCSAETVVTPEGWPEKDALRSPSVCNVGNHVWFTNPTASSYFTICDDNCSSQCTDAIKRDPCMSPEYSKVVFTMWDYAEETRNLAKTLSKCMNPLVTTEPGNTVSETGGDVDDGNGINRTTEPGNTVSETGGDVDDGNGVNRVSYSPVLFVFTFFFLQYGLTI